MVRWLATLGLVIGALLSSGFPTLRSSAQADPTQNTEAASSIVASLNAWRLENALPPLKASSTLEALALEQARYVLSLPELPPGATIHVGVGGDQPAERAQRPPYNWPAYGRPDRVAITEIAAVGTAAYAMQFWQGSELHRSAALSPFFREVGVAALPHRYGNLFIVVLGSRPNVLPALFSPAENRLYLSNENYQYAREDTGILRVSNVTLFNAEGIPISESPWALSIPLPANLGEIFYVLYSDGQREVLMPVHRQQDQILLPANMSAVAHAPNILTRTSAAAGIPAPPTQSLSPAPEDATAALPPALNADTEDVADIVLLYDERSLAVINNTAVRIDLKGLSISGSGRSLAMTQFSSVADVPLDIFPQSDCLQVWSVAVPGELPTPEGCRYRWSYLIWGPSQLFWLQGEFSADFYGIPLGSCPAGSGRCELRFPD